MIRLGFGKSKREKNNAQVPTQPSTRPENQKPPYADAHTETKFIIFFFLKKKRKKNLIVESPSPFP